MRNDSYSISAGVHSSPGMSCGVCGSRPASSVFIALVFSYVMGWFGLAVRRGVHWLGCLMMVLRVLTVCCSVVSMGGALSASAIAWPIRYMMRLGLVLGVGMYLAMVTYALRVSWMALFVRLRVAVISGCMHLMCRCLDVPGWLLGFAGHMMHLVMTGSVVLIVCGGGLLWPILYLMRAMRLSRYVMRVVDNALCVSIWYSNPWLPKACSLSVMVSVCLACHTCCGLRPSLISISLWNWLRMCLLIDVSTNLWLWKNPNL